MISVIVPVYNVENYLLACVDSILNSTFTDIEVILVDDGSTDESAALCDHAALADQRVRVIHQQNSGVSVARNAGLMASSGDYITFVDSDDVIHPQMFEILMTAISSGDYDMSMVYNQKISADERDRYIACKVTELGQNEPTPQTQADYMMSMFSYTRGNFSGPCHKLFRRELIFTQEDVFLAFNPIPAEDVEWLTRVILRLDRFILIPLNLYFYVMRTDSLTHDQTEQGINPVIIGRLKTHYQCLKLIPADKTQYRAYCFRDLYDKMKHFTCMAYGTSLEAETRSQCKVIYQETIKEFLRMPIGLPYKIKNVLFFHCPWLHRSIVNLGEWIVKLIRH